MDIAEIKETVRMQEVAEGYGLRVNRNGFAKCPFHSEKTPSMKVWRDHFKCFGCGAHGDVFSFVEMMDGCSFKEAYWKLGGRHGSPDRSASARIRAFHQSTDRAKDKRIKEELEAEVKKEGRLLTAWRDIINESEPLSEIWTQAVSNLQLTEQRYDSALQNLWKYEDTRKHAD